MSQKPSEANLQLAAQCWCDEETSHIVMDTDLAFAFAKRLDAKDAEIHGLRHELKMCNSGALRTIEQLQALQQENQRYRNALDSVNRCYDIGIVKEALNGGQHE